MSQNAMPTTNTSNGSLTGDTKIALISGIVAGVVGIALGIFVIRAVLKKRKRRRAMGMSRSLEPSFRPSHNRHQSAMERDGTAFLLPTDRSLGRLHEQQGYNSYAPQQMQSNVYSRPNVDLLPPNPPLSFPAPITPSRDLESCHLPPPNSPPSIEHRSMQHTPKHLPRLVIPNVVAVPRSAVALAIDESLAHHQPSQPVTSKSSGSAYSQPSAGEYLHQMRPARSEESVPPVPPIPGYIVVRAHHESDEDATLGRTDTVAIASMLQDRAKRISGLSRAASDVSRIERWDSVRHGADCSPDEDHATTNTTVHSRLIPPPRR